MINFLSRFDCPNPVSKFHGANMGPIWVLSVPDGLHIGPVNLAIREDCQQSWRISVNKSHSSTKDWNNIHSRTKYNILHEWPWISSWIKKRVRYYYSRDRITIFSLLWRHQQSIVTSSAELRLSETWERCVMIVLFIYIYWCIMSCKK